MYVLHPRLARTFPCIYKTCAIYVKPCMATYTLLYHISHLHGDDLVVCRSCQTWTHILGGLWPRWRTFLYMDCFRGLSVLIHASTRHVEWMATHAWPLIPCITSHTSMWMAWWFADPARPGLTSREVCDLDGGHPCVWIDLQACPTFPMHQKDMRKGGRAIHGHRYIAHTSLRMASWFENPAESGHIALVVYGLDGGHRHVCVTSQDCHTFPVCKQYI